MSEGSSNSSSNLAENLIQNEYPTYDELQKEFMKEVVMNAFLKVKIEELESKNGYLETEMATLNEDLKKSNEINIGLNKKINDLNITIDKLSNMVVFIRITNKWKSNDYDYNRMTCCEKRCVHFYKLDGCCINGNGYVQIINESNMLKYNCCLKWKGKLFVCKNMF
ncbi:hypothetical protein Mgra_00008506 [Meloidogyne graminicola]|uniref:Uncharacterized protein n=1 Tax=Meloidogyne graminicola TaxID=189291 RepID=A0A8S9ZFK7_9BILA|nr:hypothetical protein Mgra_00008506 [Meloidogyne graminicola]